MNSLFTSFVHFSIILLVCSLIMRYMLVLTNQIVLNYILHDIIELLCSLTFLCYILYVGFRERRYYKFPTTLLTL